MPFPSTKWVLSHHAEIPTKSGNRPSSLLCRLIRRRPKNQFPCTTNPGAGHPNTPFGIALNGVLFDPGTAEFYMGDRLADWNYEALGGAVLLGLDENHGHVQPNGSYHYHGLPTAFLNKLGVSPRKHSPMIGYAMDGYPIYALYGYKDPTNPESGIKKLTSKLSNEERSPPESRLEANTTGPSARIMNMSRVREIWMSATGDSLLRKEYPKGTYAYFLTANWPVIPRYFKAEPLRLRGIRRPRQVPPFR